MHLVRKTWNRMICTIIVLLFTLWCVSVAAAYYIGAVQGHALGVAKGDINNPLKAVVESEKMFCYDKGVITIVKKGKKSFIPEFK